MMTKEERNKNAEELLETAKKISQIDDLELKGVARAFMLGYMEGRLAGAKAVQKQTA